MSPRRTDKAGSLGLNQAPERKRAGTRLTERDAEIVMAVYRYRALTSPLVQKLFFETNGSTGEHNSAGKLNTRCQLRLQRLFEYGYLARDEQPQKLSDGRRPYMYRLTARGAALVQELLDDEELDWRPGEQPVSPFFLEHLLATNTVRVAITVAARHHGFTVEEWLDDRTLKRRQMTDTVTLRGPNGATQRAAVVPDGFFVLKTPSALYHHFLEVDLRTVTGLSSQWQRRDWARKVAAYLEYYRSGRYTERYKTQGLRVLTVTTGEKRLDNLRSVTEKTGGRGRFWFSTFERIERNDVLVDPIWTVASKEGLYALTW
jgi:hypothetical protein